MKERLDYKIQLWNYLDEQINSIEAKIFPEVSFITTVIATAIGVIIKLNSGSEQAGSLEQAPYLLYVIPLFLLMVLAHIASQYRKVAIMRGYLGRLEESINKDIKQNIYYWNSGYIPTFVKRNQVMYIFMILFVLISVLVVVSDLWFVFAFKMVATSINVIYSIVLVAFFGWVLYQFVPNDKIMADSYKYLDENINNKKTSSKKHTVKKPII